MSNTIISFTTIEYPNEASMEKSLEIFQDLKSMGSSHEV